MAKRARSAPEVRERAGRLVFEHESEYPSQGAAVESIASKFGCAAETLRNWVRQAERERYGVEPICRELPIAASTYREQKARQADPGRLPPRLQRDAVLCEQFRRFWQENQAVQGARECSGSLAGSRLPWRAAQWSG